LNTEAVVAVTNRLFNFVSLTKWERKKEKVRLTKIVILKKKQSTYQLISYPNMVLLDINVISARKKNQSLKRLLQVSQNAILKVRDKKNQNQKLMKTPSNRNQNQRTMALIVMTKSPQTLKMKRSSHWKHAVISFIRSLTSGRTVTDLMCKMLV